MAGVAIVIAIIAIGTYFYMQYRQVLPAQPQQIEQTQLERSAVLETFASSAPNTNSPDEQQARAEMLTEVAVPSNDASSGLKSTQRTPQEDRASLLKAFEDASNQ